MMKILVLFVGITLVFSVLLSSQSFAVDFRDSNGYTPDWAKPLGPYQTLSKCSTIVSEMTKDGNWCFEWIAYVVDQGYENFPESATGKQPTLAQSNFERDEFERICVKNHICAFPGDYLRYRETDSYFGDSDISEVHFKERIDDKTIRVFIDGFGRKPLMWELNTKTGIQRNEQYNAVIPFNLLEPIPMDVGQKVFRHMEIEPFLIRLTSEESGTFQNMKRTLLIGTLEEEGSIMEHIYDKETGVLISAIENYELDGKWYKEELKLIDTNMFSEPITIVSEKDVPMSKLEAKHLLKPNLEETRITKSEQGITQLDSDDSNDLVDEESIYDDPNYYLYVILGISLFFGIPAIIIGLIIWKIKQRKARKLKIGGNTD